MKMNCGIYILESASGNQYVGSSKQIKTRIRSHLSALARGTHYSIRLQRAFSKHGALTARTLLVCAEADLIFFEQRAIDVLAPKYNGTLEVNRPIINDEIRAKMSASKTGVKQPQAMVDKRAAKLRGKTRSPEAIARYQAAAQLRGVPEETRAKATAANKGRKRSPEAVAKSAAANTGRKNSAETIAKMSAVKMGKKRTPQQIARHAAAMTGRKASDETKAKMSAARKGKKLSEAVRANMAAAWIIRKQNKEVQS